MRPSRRQVLAAGAGGLALAGLAWRSLPDRRRTPDGAIPITVEATPIAAFRPAEPGRRRFGALTYRSGLALRSEARAFGGFSGLWRSANGARIVAVSDRGTWLTARLDRDGDGLTGLSDAVLAPVLGPDGPLGHGPGYDVEALAIADGVAYLAAERVQRVLRFDWRGEGVAARGRPLPLPGEVRALPGNKGLEAIAIAPDGALVAVAERARWGDDAPTRGFIFTGPAAGTFDVVRSGGYDITDLAFLDGGEALLLERRYALVPGPSVRLRRIAAGAMRPGARVDGPVIAEAGADHEIDNMEGLAVHRDAAGTAILTLISDDNFSPLQRTLLLEFALDG